MARSDKGNPGPYTAVRGLSRGLEVLAALNERPAGHWGIAELSVRTALHHTTLKRILETLRAQGYVELHIDTGRYHLTGAVRALSAGYREDDLVASVGARLLPRLTKTLRWPLVLSTPEGDAMLTRAETHSLSPLAFHRTTYGLRFPMLETAMGRAYLVACSKPRRRVLLALAANAPGHGRRSLDDLETGLNRNVADGFGCNSTGWGPFTAFNAISAPVRLPDRIAGSLTIGFPARVMNCHQAIREIGDPLAAAAADIAAAVMDAATQDARAGTVQGRSRP